MKSEKEVNNTIFSALSIAFGVIGFFVAGLLFGTTAVVLGIVAGCRGYTLGWVGAALGIIDVIGWGIVVSDLFLQACNN